MNTVGKKWNSKNRSYNVVKFSNYDKTSIFLLLENLKKGIIIRSSLKIKNRKEGIKWKVNFMKRTSY